jgi:RNA polymerase sigma-70 factor (ECF subfamily)
MSGDRGGDGEENDALMRRVAVGDRAAFESLVRRNLRRTLAIAQGVTGNAHDADEVVQEAFMRVWQHADRWRPEQARFTTWLYRIVVNLCLDRRRRPQWLPLDTVAELPAVADSAPELIARDEHRRAVAAAMTRLSDRQRAAITLFYFEDLSGKEAAGVMGLKIAAFEQLLLRARRAVKAELGRAGLPAAGLFAGGVWP